MVLAGLAVARLVQMRGGQDTRESHPDRFPVALVQTKEGKG